MSHDLIYLPVDAQERSLVRWYRASRFSGKVEQLLGLLELVEQYASSGEELSRMFVLARARSAEQAHEERLERLAKELAETRGRQVEMAERIVKLEAGVALNRQISVTSDVMGGTPAGSSMDPHAHPNVERVSVAETPALDEAGSAAESQVVSTHSGRQHENEQGGEVPLELTVAGERIAGRNVPAFLNDLARLLLRRQLIPEGFLPFGTGTKRYIAAQNPVHPSGKGFFKPVGADGLYIEAHCSRTRALECARALVEVLGLPAGISISHPGEKTRAPVVRGGSSHVPEEPGLLSSPVLYCRYKRVEARGRMTPGGFLVLKDSQSSLIDQPSLKNTSVGLATLRRRLIEEGVLRENSDHYVFTRDFEFRSSSAAGLAVCGYPVSGPMVWTTRDGLRLRELK